jgi:hypothetical protein
MSHSAASRAAMNAQISAEVRTCAPLDRETQLRKQIFFMLDGMQKSRDAMTLVEMNGDKCASRQIFRLHAYDRPQRKILGGDGLS